MPTRAPTPPIAVADLDLTLRHILKEHTPEALTGHPVSLRAVLKALTALAWKRRGWKP